MKEFDLIKQYFAHGGHERRDTLVGIGDDAAVTEVAKNQLLVTTTDTLVQDVHFLPNTPAAAVAHKAINVNLSDLAAMGAEPAWISLSLSLPHIDEAWVEEFSATLHEQSEYFSFQLIGGDTVQGPLSVTITAQGFIPADNALLRSGAQAGDWLFVTGTLGDAGLGLDIARGDRDISDPQHKEFLINRHYKPTARMLAGTTLRRAASACIDVSDGLLQDLQHVLRASNKGAMVHLDKLPISAALGESVQQLDDALRYACYAGDDYELLFTVSEEHRVTIETALKSYNIQATCIGQITGAVGKVDLRLNDNAYTFDTQHNGFEHFS